MAGSGILSEQHFGEVRFALASAEDRLPESIRFGECEAILGVMRAGSVHKAGYGHKWQAAAAAPLVA